MKQRITKRIEKLEGRAGINDEVLVTIIQSIRRDKEGKRIITGGLRLRNGKPPEELPVSFFDNEEHHEKT